MNQRENLKEINRSLAKHDLRIELPNATRNYRIVVYKRIVYDDIIEYERLFEIYSKKIEITKPDIPEWISEQYKEQYRMNENETKCKYSGDCPLNRIEDCEVETCSLHELADKNGGVSE